MQVDIFHGHNVRTEVKDGKVWFAIPDVAAVLGIKNSRDVASRPREKDVDIIYTHTNGGQQGINFVNERGLIRILQTSRSPWQNLFRIGQMNESNSS